MKLAIVVPAPVVVSDSGQGNGMSIAIWAVEVARRLSREMEVVVYHQSGGFRQIRPTVERVDGVDYVGIPVGFDVRVERLQRRRRRQDRDRVVRRSYYALFAARVAADARRRGVDIVHVANHPQWASLIRRVVPGSRTVLHMHANWLVQVRRGAVTASLRHCDRISGVSHYVTDAARSRFPELGDRFFTIHNGADVDVLAADVEVGRPERPDPELLFVGRLSPEKGVHVLLPAFERVLDTVPQARLTLVGGVSPTPRALIVDLDPDPVARALARFYDPDATYLETVLGSVSPATLGRVSIVGPVPQEEVRAWYRRSTALVFPVVGNETLGMPLAEAMLCGLPVVSTAAGGTPEVVVDGVTGLLVRRDDVDALAAAMVASVTDAESARLRARRALDAAREAFSWDRVVAELRRHLPVDTSAPSGSGRAA